MTDSEHDHDPNREVDDLLGSLRRVQVPLESRTAIRQTVASELARIGQQRQARHIPVWRRTITVPWPVLAACAAILVFVTTMTSRMHDDSSTRVERFDRTIQPTQGPPEAGAPTNGSLSSPTETTEPSSSGRPQLVYHETATYLCGVGSLQSETMFSFEENQL